MAVTVYADVLVIVNLYVDFFLLWATRRVLQLRAKPWRLAAGALVGGLCTLACLLPQPWWASLLWGGVSAAAVTAAAFCPLSRRGFLKTALCFWVFSLGLAGLCLFLIQWAGAPSLAVVGHTIYLDLSLPLLFACTAGAYGVLWALQKLFHREDFVPRACRLAITYQGKTVTLWAKADTGCALREPFSGLPVIVCQASALEPLLPPGAGEGLPGEGFRLVPFESVGGSGMLPAFRPDSVHLEPAGTALACYVALWQRGPGAPGFPAGDFQALYGPDQFPELSPTR